MTAVIIILAVLLVLSGLLLLPVTLKASFEKELKASVHYLFFRYTIAPQKKTKKKKRGKPKGEKKESAQKKEEQDLNAIRDIIRQTGLSGFLDLVKELAKAAGGVLKGIFRHTVLSKLYINIRAGGEDAADAAVTYGYICAAVYPAAGILTSAVKKYKKLQICINPDFDRKESTIVCTVQARISMFFLLGSAVKGAYKLLKQFIKTKQRGIL